MAFEAAFQGFSVMQRKLLLTTPISVSKSKSIPAPGSSGYEIELSVPPIAGPWRISQNVSEYVTQKFIIEAEKIVASATFSSTSPSTRVATTAALQFGVLGYTLDTLLVHKPYVFSPLCKFSLAVTTGSNPVVPRIDFFHSTDDIPVPSSPGDGIDPTGGPAYTVMYPGLISQFGFAWNWSASSPFSTAVTLSLTTEITKLWLNVAGLP